MASPVLNGALLGLSVAMPFGPIALLCVQRSIAAGPRLGIVTGLGAACVQGTYATLAIMGAGAFADHLAQWDHPVRLVSAGLLVALGLRILVRRPPAMAAVRPPRADHAFASSVGLALSNPLTVMPYLLVASTAAASDAVDRALTPWSVPGVVLAAGGWYTLVSFAAALLRSGLPPGAMRMFNHLSGATLVGFGILAALHK